MRMILVWLVCGTIAWGTAVPMWSPQPRAARAALEQAGYSRIEVGGYAYRRCDRQEWSTTRFTAKLNRAKVTGVVCKNYYGGIRILLDPPA